MSSMQRILVRADSRYDQSAVIDRAVQLLASGGQITLLDVVREISWPARLFVRDLDAIQEQRLNHASQHLNELRDALAAQGVQVKTLLREGHTSVALIREAIQGSYDLVISSTKGRLSGRRGFFGTTATRLLRNCPCPVLLLAPDQDFTSRRVVAAIDASAEDATEVALNGKILELAEQVNRLDGSRLDVVHAWGIYGESILKEHMKPEEFEELEAKSHAHASAKLETSVQDAGVTLPHEQLHALHGDPGPVIAQFVNDLPADLLVLGTVGRAGLSGLLMGNIAEQILDKVDCSVLAVKPEGFVSPIHP